MHVLAQVKSMSALFRKKIFWTADKIPWCLSQRYAVVCVHAHKNKKFQLEVIPQNSSPDGKKSHDIFHTLYTPPIKHFRVTAIVSFHTVDYAKPGL